MWNQDCPGPWTRSSDIKRLVEVRNLRDAPSLDLPHWRVCLGQKHPMTATGSIYIFYPGVVLRRSGWNHRSLFFLTTTLDWLAVNVLAYIYCWQYCINEWGEDRPVNPGSLPKTQLGVSAESRLRAHGVYLSQGIPFFHRANVEHSKGYVLKGGDLINFYCFIKDIPKWIGIFLCMMKLKNKQFIYEQFIYKWPYN